MTRNLSHKSNVQNNKNRQTPASPRTPKDVENMLREIAFVLKMTRKIHDEMQADQEAAEAVTA